MRRDIIRFSIGLVLICLYPYALLYFIGIGATLFAPYWLSDISPTRLSALLSWMVLCHTFAVILASIPFAIAVARLYPRYWVPVG
jgi:hypothetical protein